MSEHVYSGLSRGLAVLEMLARDQCALGLAEIAKRLGMSKSGAHGLLATLVECGYVERLEGGIYRLGIKVWEMGRSAPIVKLVDAAAPVMARLVERTQEGAIFGILSGFDVTYIHQVESSQAVRVHAQVGDRIPGYCTSTGLALLAFQDSSYLDRHMPAKLDAFTPHTVVDSNELRRELERVRARGYAVNRGGWRIDVGGIAVPVPLGSGAPRAGLCIAVPLYRMTKEWIQSGVHEIREAAHEIATAMGQDMDQHPRLARS